MISRERLRQANRRAQRVYPRYYEPDDEYRCINFDKRKALGILRHTRKQCSSFCCGNPRRHFGKCTLQERKAPQPSDLWYSPTIEELAEAQGVKPCEDVDEISIGDSPLYEPNQS